MRRISSIQFGILDPDFIVRACCVYPHECVVVTTDLGPRSQFFSSEHLCDLILSDCFRRGDILSQKLIQRKYMTKGGREWVG